MIKAQQIKMIKRLLTNENLLWKPTMEAIICIPNLDLFLRSNFPVPKNTSNFYTAVLKSWKEFEYESFNSKEDILNQYLWYNEKLKITVAGDLLMIISCLYACVFRSASVCLSVRCE